MNNRLVRCAVLLSLQVFLYSCEGDTEIAELTLTEEAALGLAIRSQIENDSSFVVVSREQFATSYAYVDGLLNEILASEAISHTNDVFDWNITLLDNEDLLHSFSAPGGQLFIYTGLIFFLDKEDDLAGVISHEAAHIDERHTSLQLQRRFGVSSLKEDLSGNQGLLAEITALLSSENGAFSYSPAQETAVDSLSVRYLSTTTFSCDGMSDVFEKLIRFSAQRNPPFLLTHIGTPDRNEAIDGIANTLNCNTTIDNGSVTRYISFRNSLP